MKSDVPTWCDWGPGPGRVVVVAPHGGSKSHPAHAAVPRRGDKRQKINDLHTADLAATVADALGASFVINRGMDRNRLDLNRISQVADKAPWFLALLSDLIAGAAARHGEAHLLVIHGWNVNQRRCDLGVGANLSDHPPAWSQLTISREFLDHYLRPLVDTDASRSCFTLGRRYPARHRNNLMQLFRRDGTRTDILPQPLAEVVRGGRCEAVQLELGIPLRWPGRSRDELIDRLTAVFGRPRDACRKAANAPATAASAAGDGEQSSSGSGALQTFDPESGVAVLASIDRFPGTDMAFGRVAIFLADGRVGLYTGEARGLRELGVDGPRFSGDDRELGFEFDGSILVTDNGDDYVDLERALARSVLARAHIRLRHIRSEAPTVGEVTGEIAIDGRPHRLRATGFSASRQWGIWRSAARAQWSLRAAFDDAPATILRSTSWRGSHAPVTAARILLADDRYAPEEITVETAERTMRVRPLSRMSIARPVGPGRRARVTFGPARIDSADGSGRGFGLFEYARLIDR